MEINEQNMKEDKELNKEENKKNKKKPFISIIIILICLFLTFAVAAILFNQSRSVLDAHKPIIYLYPKEKTELTVSLGNPEKLSCSYPQYDEDGWQVVANPDGSLIDKQTGRNLYALYWEGKNYNASKFDEGFVVKSVDTIEFLEEKLALLGLNEREAEEFIVYWLPKLQKNKYNLIRFASQDEIDEYMPINFSVQPDSVIRVFMQFKGLNEPIDIKEQNLVTPARDGFVAVEWGGSEAK